MKKIALVNLKGGFGNQLFQIIFAEYLKNFGFSVFIDTSFYNLNDNYLTKNEITKRSLTLPLSIFNLKKTNKFYLVIFKSLFHLLKKFNKKFNRKIYANKFTGHEFDINEVGYINIFDGYWKNLKFLEYNSKFLIDCLSKNKKFKLEFKKNVNKNTLLVHVRRTDFLKNGWELSEDFYLESIDFVIKKKGKQKIDIFTDDENWVKNTNFYKKFNVNSIFAVQQNESPFNDFIKMLNYENFIIGNSTFAFFPPYMKAKDENIVIVPDPWFKYADHPDISKENWIKIKNN